MFDTWNERFTLAQKYYEKNGNLNMGNFKTKDGITYDEEGFPLRKWLNRQRTQFNLGELTEEHRQKLESIGFIFENINNLKWNEFYEQVLSYLHHNKSLNIPKNFRTINGCDMDESGKNLGAWWHIQITKYNKGTLSVEQSEKIKKLHDVLNEYAVLEWNTMYELAKKYYEKYNCLIIKKKYVLYDENNNIVDMTKLANWISKQRRDYIAGKLSQERINKLKTIGIVFENITETEWERMYKLACIYSKEYGNLKVSRHFKTKDGKTFDKCGSPLGKWLNAQYSNNANGTLSLEHKQKLEKIGMIFINQTEKNWNEMLELTIIYLKEHGNLNIPVDFRTVDGITYDSKGKKLGEWLNRQKTNGIRNKLSLEHRQKLESIGMIFENAHLQKWEKMYECARKYYEVHKNLEIPSDFKTIDGIVFDEEGESLGCWIKQQQTYYNYKSLSKERMKKLELIGMTSKNTHDTNWEKMYKLAKAYYMHYYDLRVRSDFKTIDGISYDEEGENLGCWISTQRAKYKAGTLSEQKIKKLELIGMIFEIAKNKNQNEIICMTHDIDYKGHKKEIDSIPYREFSAKVNYLNDNGIPFIIDNKLHPIFFTSSINMSVRYGISLEQMINNYDKQVEKAKQKMIKVGL